MNDKAAPAPRPSASKPNPAPSRDIVVVTGASRGIGFELAKCFAANGHNVLMVARDAHHLANAAAAVRSAHPAVRVEVLSLDVSAGDAPARIDATVASRGFVLDVLVNNAAIGLGGAFVGQDPAAIDKLLSVNIAAVTRLMRHVLPAMQARGKGAVVNVASLGAYAPGPHQAAYYASKAFVVSLSEAVASELYGTGVRVSAVVPGPVETTFHEQMGADRAWYRYLMPSLTAEAVARSTYRGYRLGQRVITPGLFNALMRSLMSVMPHAILVPLVGWLLKPPAPRS